ncbi:MAG TPA: thioesterase family protein [Motiliproteus sp.]
MSTATESPTAASNPGGACFTTHHLVRFSHVDPAGIAYFPRIHNFIHESFENLWEEYIGVRYYHLIQHQQIAFPMVHSEVEFLHPLRFGDRPVVKVSCFKLGRSSLGLRYRFEVNDTLCVDASTTTVCINTASAKSIPIPDAYRPFFERIMTTDEQP